MPVDRLTLITEEAGNGSKVAFDANIKIFAETDLVVRKKSAAGVYTDDLVLNTDYTVEFDTEEETVTVTYTVAPVGSGGGSFIARSTPLDQETELPREGSMPSKSVQNMIDRLTLQVQELSERLDRAAVQPQAPSSPEGIVIDPPEDRRGLIYEEQDDGSFLIVNTESDPDEVLEDAAASATAAAASAATAAAAVATVYASGTFASRPAAPASLYWYYSTDLGSLEIYVPAAARWFLIG